MPKSKKSDYTKSQLAAIVESSDDAIIAKTTEGIITSWNKGAEKLYGYKENEILNKSISLLFPNNKMDEYYLILEAIKKGNPLHYFETERVHKDGHIIFVSITISAIKNQRNKVIGACSIARDVSEWKKIDTMKNEFISVVSHELRTPLTAISGSLSLLASQFSEKLPEKEKMLIKIAGNNCERLMHLINTILDIEKITAETMKFNFQLINLTELIQETINKNKVLAENNAVKIDFSKMQAVTVHADYDKIAKVVANLLTNAIRYSPKNATVLIEIKKMRTKTRVSVIDHGEGIPKHFHTKIFNAFSQADASDTRHKSGTGLGLKLCKAIIDKHGGKIAFKSLERGTHFYFELPCT